MTKDDLNSLCWPAMRYALGRKSYVVEMVCQALIRNADNIRQDIKQRMAEEIVKAIKDNQAGMEMDVIEWEMVLEAFGVKYE
jgi:hypothetical protein